MSNVAQALTELRARAQAEFNEAADYYWKAPNLIEHELVVEFEKLDEYFPNDSQARRWRWEHETRRLYRVFPFLIGTGNLFSVLALFEVLLLQLGSMLEADGGPKLADTTGHGAGRLLAYFRKRGIPVQDLDPWHQVQAGIKIRHCFTHSSGFLAHSREAPELRRIVASKTYLRSDHRPKGDAPDWGDKTAVLIVGTGPLERLQIGTHYAWLIAAYLRDYFDALCAAAA